MTTHRAPNRFRLLCLMALEYGAEQHPDREYIAARYDELLHMLDYEWSTWADLLADDPQEEERLRQVHMHQLASASHETIVNWAMEALDRYDSLRARLRVDPDAKIEYPEEFWT